MKALLVIMGLLFVIPALYGLFDLGVPSSTLARIWFHMEIAEEDDGFLTGIMNAMGAAYVQGMLIKFMVGLTILMVALELPTKGKDVKAGQEKK